MTELSKSQCLEVNGGFKLGAFLACAGIMTIGVACLITNPVAAPITVQLTVHALGFVATEAGLLGTLYSACA